MLSAKIKRYIHVFSFCLLLTDARRHSDSLRLVSVDSLRLVSVETRKGVSNLSEPTPTEEAVTLGGYPGRAPLDPPCSPDPTAYCPRSYPCCPAIRQRVVPVYLDPYRKPDNAFADAYGCPGKSSQWDARVGSFGHEHLHLRLKDAFHAMLWLIREALNVEFHGNRMACETRFPFGEAYEKDCWEKVLEYLHGTITLLYHINNEVDFPTQRLKFGFVNRFFDEAMEILNNYEISAEERKNRILHSSVFNIYRKTDDAIEKPDDAFACANYEWVFKRRPTYDRKTHKSAHSDPEQQRFFCDRAGFRQGMWVMLHTIASLRHKFSGISLRWGKSTRPLEAYMFTSFSTFIDEFVAHWNPCPVCRRLYKADMPDMRNFTQDPRIYLWMYHNEVSMRVRAGYIRDFGPDGPLRAQFHLESVPLFGLDKRWPSEELCPDCWADDCEKGAEAETPDLEAIDADTFNPARFLKSFDVKAVRRFLTQVYTGATYTFGIGRQAGSSKQVGDSKQS